MSGTPDILKKIVAVKKKRISKNKALLESIASNLDSSASSLDFARALNGEKLAIIAEIKKASPSLGLISKNFDPVNFAKIYANSGADAISVLTEEDFFLGSIIDLKKAKDSARSLPVLRKDFIIDPLQIYESKAIGADSFLLICAILTDEELQNFISIGRNLGMEPLVETHTEKEIKKALDCGARIIGVNNRNLKNFHVSLSTSFELVKFIPDNIIKVSESGIKSREDCLKLRSAGFNAILVGETFMKSSTANFANLIKNLKV